jgi:hypothetical protein
MLQSAFRDYQHLRDNISGSLSTAVSISQLVLVLD